MTALILPDIHEQIDIVENIISKVSNDTTIIFLGDYFDSYNSSTTSKLKTIDWLKKSLEHKNRIHLLGNHDIQYACDNPYTFSKYKCSGYSKKTHELLNRYFTKQDWSLFKLYYWMNDILFTHAGLSSSFFHMCNPDKHHKISKTDVNDFLKESSIHAFQTLDNYRIPSTLLLPGIARGGTNKYGGITWNDAVSEFDPIESIYQCFGHTLLCEHMYFRYDNKYSICLDCDLECVGYIASEYNNNIEIKYL